MKNKDKYSSKTAAWDAYLKETNTLQSAIDTWIADHTYASYKKLYDKYVGFTTWLWSSVPLLTYLVTYTVSGDSHEQTFKITTTNQSNAESQVKNMFKGKTVTIISVTQVSA